MHTRMTIGGVVAALAVGSCTVEVPPLVPADRASSVRVTVAASDRGAPEARRPFSLTPDVIGVDLEVLGPNGRRLDSFDGYVELRAEPGVIDSIESSTESFGPHVRITGGMGTGLRIHLVRAYSDVRIWAEEIGYRPAAPAAAACSNGVDDDGDGHVDFPADVGCRYANDDDETLGSHAIGVSDVLFYANPSLADVQGRSSATPLAGRLVTVDQGEMIVTRITTDGFYVSEVADGAVVPWGSLFVFNFNTPPFLQPCDRIVRVSGSMTEFFGFTELNFPAWKRDKWCPPGMAGTDTCVTDEGLPLEPRACPIPEPVVLDDTVLGSPDMEMHEAEFIRIRGLRMPTRFGPAFPPEGSNCDLDGDGNVNLDPGPERDCSRACDAELACSEWNQFLEFGQFAMHTDTRVINVVTRDSVPDFEPTEHLGETFDAVSGTLRHFAPLGPQRGFILEPRCGDDVVPIGGTIKPSNEACVTPRTGGPVDTQ